MDQFVDCKDERFEIGCFSAAGECIAVHRNTSLLWSFSIQMKVVERITRSGKPAFFLSAEYQGPDRVSLLSEAFSYRPANTRMGI